MRGGKKKEIFIKNPLYVLSLYCCPKARRCQKIFPMNKIISFKKITCLYLLVSFTSQGNQSISFAIDYYGYFRVCVCGKSNACNFCDLSHRWLVCGCFDLCNMMNLQYFSSGPSLYIQGLVGSIVVYRSPKSPLRCVITLLERSYGEVLRLQEVGGRST